MNWCISFVIYVYIVWEIIPKYHIFQVEQRTLVLLRSIFTNILIQLLFNYIHMHCFAFESNYFLNSKHIASTKEQIEKSHS